MNSYREQSKRVAFDCFRDVIVVKSTLPYKDTLWYSCQEITSFCKELKEKYNIKSILDLRIK